MNAIKLLFFIFLCSSVFAQSLDFNSAEYVGIQIKASNLDVKFQESTTNVIKIFGIDKNQWNFKTDSSKNLIIEENTNYTKKTLSEFLDNSSSVSVNNIKKKMLIQAPSVSLDVRVRKGDFFVENLRRDFNYTAVSGSVKLIKTSGEGVIFLNSGEINVDSHVGKLKLEGFQLKTVVKNSQSDIQTRTHTINFSLEKNIGVLNLQSYQGQFLINQNSGVFFLDQAKGSLGFSGNIGRLEANLGDVSMDLKLAKDQEAAIKIQSGKITAASTQGSFLKSGALMSLISKESDIYLPGALRSQKVKNENQFKSRMSGEKTQTRLEVKSNNALIIIK